MTCCKELYFIAKSRSPYFMIAVLRVGLHHFCHSKDQIHDARHCNGFIIMLTILYDLISYLITFRRLQNFCQSDVIIATQKSHRKWRLSFKNSDAIAVMYIMNEFN